jgi:UDP-N-acetylmuramate: L-alanyl-gamma-D-glutamyl-meso-diaminopimelate ligase
MHIHILGICGTFMGGVALLARAAGHRVTGCDAHVYPPMSAQLEAEAIELIDGYGEEQLGLAPDLWVIGNVVARGNPLMEAILDRGLRYVSGPEWLADNILQSKWVLAVAGTHGKTTTSSMLTWILEAAGKHPGFLIGGVPENFGRSARLTDSPLFVIEADEYDTAFFDKRSKFVHYPARTAVLNNLEFDHADIFSDLAAIETQFHHFVRIVRRSGLIISNAEELALERVLRRGCWTPVERFGAGGEWEARETGTNEFKVRHGSTILGKANWELLGAHNRMNALAAIAAARHAGVEPETALAALARFRNVKRRLEVRGVVAGITVYDDFAHHPTAIAATIGGLRGKVGKARIVAVLEPRSNTMKLGVMKERLAGSLAQADCVACFTGGLEWDAAAALAPLGPKVRCFGELDAMVGALAQQARAGDHVLVMSNGSFGGLHAKLLEALRALR